MRGITLLERSLASILFHATSVDNVYIFAIHVSKN
jgi:hypothetical protein